MSEYQYYEFHAIDRPLTDEEQATLRRYSGRATITPTRFLNNYSFGSFKGNESEWMEKYFDAFLYLANWGTHQLMLRLPVSVLPLDSVNGYCAGDKVSARVAGEHIILEFRSEDEECDGGWIDDDNDTLAALVPVRAELASGDLRALYIAWLGSARLGGLDNDHQEPPCPPGLRNLSPALEAFAAFMRIDRDMIEAAATTSPELIATDTDAIRLWVSPWRELDALIATKQPKKYDEAIALLRDLRDVCARDGRQTTAAARIARLREEHAKKPSFVERLRKAGLDGEASR